MSDSNTNAAARGMSIHWYVVRDVLGHGGFGITYLAEDENLKTSVAVKEYLPRDIALRNPEGTVECISPDHADEFRWGLKRFLEEARVLAKFDHPNIVRVLSVFEAHGTAYMVMRFEHGRPLDKLLKIRGTLSEREVLNILLPILDGLSEIHKAGFIHRDIKPANIYVREDGSPVLLDFGSARQALQDRTGTLTRIISPGFAPTEQYDSVSTEQGPWTDIYALGATLYRAIVGRNPVPAIDRSNAVIRGVGDTYISVQHLVGDKYSHALLKATDHALALSRHERPASIEEWRMDFDGIAPLSPETEATTVLNDHGAKAGDRVRAGHSDDWRGTAGRWLQRISNTPWSLAAWLTVSAAALPLVLHFSDPGNHVSKAAADRSAVSARLPGGIDVEISGDAMRSFNDAMQFVYLEQFQKALPRLRNLAEQNFPPAEFLLGMLYEIGTEVGLKRDAVLAKQLFEDSLSSVNDAAEAGALWAMTMLGAAYKRGFAVSRNIGRWRQLITEAAEGGHAYAQLLLAQAYQSGQGMDRNDAEALRWYRRAKSSGMQGANYAIGLCYFEGRCGLDRDVKTAMRLMEDAASHGYVTAQASLGSIYYNGGLTSTGPLIPVDLERAAHWYERAAANGNIKAKVALSVLYRRGDGVPQDYAAASRLLEEAAKVGDPIALGTLGIAYATGELGLPQDYQKAAEYYGRAAALGNIVATAQLGVLYTLGRGVPKDFQRAFDLLTRAADQGDATALYHLGLFYETDEAGIPKDEEKAHELMQRAARLNYVQAVERLAQYYHEGLGVPVDDDEAIRLYRQAVVLGSTTAMRGLAALYEHGKGSRSFVEAYAWLNVAAALGSAEAAGERDSLADKLKRAELDRANALSKRYFEQYAANIRDGN